MHDAWGIRMNNKPKLLLSDLDGVYVDWAKGFVRYMASIGHIAPHSNPTVFSMVDIFPQLEKPWIHIKDYQQSEFYSQIAPYAGAREAYQDMADAGIKIIAVSSCGLEAETVRMRTEFIEAEGFFSDMILLDLGASKQGVLETFTDAAFIDDQPHVAYEGLEAGHIALLKTMPYNLTANVQDMIRIDAFDELKKVMDIEPAPSIVNSSILNIQRNAYEMRGFRR
tara:strand:- start:2822 stop:3493 length:672 start_codon:yes stop_codon:yes gene_type:complete